MKIDIKNLNIWKKTEKDDYRESEKRCLVADFDAIDEAVLSPETRNAAETIMAFQAAALSGAAAAGTGKSPAGSRKKAARPVLMKFNVFLVEKDRSVDISELELTSRASNSLKRSGIMTVGDLVRKVTVPEEMGFIRQCGVKSRNDILWKLFDYQLRSVPKDLKKAYINGCARLCDPPEKEETKTERSAPEVCETRDLSVSFRAFSFLDLSPEEEEIADALRKEIAGSSFLYPLYVTERLREMQLEDMGLSVRAFHCLKRAGIGTAGELLDSFTDGTELYRIRNCGERSAAEIFARLFLTGYDLLPEENRGEYKAAVLRMNR